MLQTLLRSLNPYYDYQNQPPVTTTSKARAIELLDNPGFTSSVDLENVQGDIYPTFPKKAEHFLFFTIKDAAKFKVQLGDLIPHITTAAKVISNLSDLTSFKATISNSPSSNLMPMEQIQVAFSREGFPLIGIEGGVGEELFDISQFDDAINLGDHPAPGNDLSNKTVPDWEEVWRTKVHGVFAIATESEEHCKNVSENRIKAAFNESIDIINVVKGHVRTKDEGHEHFGFLDGISQPAIRGLASPHKGQLECDAGVILMGHDNDPVQCRPEWTKEGSIMVFRKLQQFVPEFAHFLDSHPLNLPGLDPVEGSALRGARMFGRWKSGAPTDLAPRKDDESLAQDIDKINDFDFSKLEPGELYPGQVRCPFTAHIRKTAPRKGSYLDPKNVEAALIIRAGIPYGQDVTQAEEEAKITSIDRGLLFVCYSSTLDPGFRFMQRTWANSETFPGPFPGQPPPSVLRGLDPIIGSNASSTGSDLCIDRATTGTNPEDPNEVLVMPNHFVLARGGEYFFVPSMATLRRLASGECLLTGVSAAGDNPG